ncbi:MAG: histidinol dehydrogenase [Actinomycetales bacterium]|nr:histidinol dehydrogenase [Actinomycetales bacterium]
MIRRIDLRGSHAEPRDVLPRAAVDVEQATATVGPIVLDVRERGAEAVLDWTERLDGVRPAALRVPVSAIEEAVAALDPAVRAALEESIRRARIVHADQRRTDITTVVVPGGTVTERWLPVARVGLYVPGGRAVYPSSVVMNVVPAQIAGVASLCVVSPAQRDHGGLPHPTILAACGLLGIDEVYAAGGAQAVAMLAFGVELPGGGRCEPVDMVTGPGNIYVTAAKRMLKGRVGIDSEAGPTEVAVLADDTADAAHVAADLISQAEHDTIAAAVLVTTSPELALAVEGEVEAQLARTKHVERISEALSGSQSGIVLVDDLDQGLRVIDAYAAEHLEIHTRDAREVALRVRNAGAIFVGGHAPVSLGDYCAGSNHVLPTGGTAAHCSGLSVQTFLRGIHVVDYDRAALADVADHVVALALAEDLPGHAAAITIRLQD